MSRYYRSILNVQGGAAIDPDAQAFLTAAGIVDATITSAINNLVLGLKGASLWAKMKAIYPFVGGTATTHKFNLKDPRDLDAAFRITWFGGVTQDANGVQGNGINGYGDTHLLRSIIGQNSLAWGCYSQTNQLRTEYEFGAIVASPTSGSHFLSRYSVGTAGRNQNSSSFTLPTTFPRSDGFFSHWRESSTLVKVARETLIQSITDNSVPIVGDNSFFILGSNVGAGVLSLPSSKKYSLHFFGQNFTETDYNNLKSINLTFQTALSRNV